MNTNDISFIIHIKTLGTNGATTGSTENLLKVMEDASAWFFSQVIHWPVLHDGDLSICLKRL
jgi:hypothetical protein